MNSQPASTTDLHAPLPTRQFFTFLFVFHVLFLVGLVLTFFAHWRALQRPPGASEGILAGLLAMQILLYLVFFVIPSLTSWASFGWFRELLGNLAAPPGEAAHRPALGWWWAYIAASVVIVLAECRIQPGFAWALIAYFGHISALPLRKSVPAGMLILAAFLLNHFGWRNLVNWDAGDWFSVIFRVAPAAALILFLGRTVVTSGERGKLIVELEAAQRELELARQREGELAALRERERLARDLHDSLGHSLVTLTVQLEAAQRLLATDTARATALLAETQRLTRSSMDDLRRSLANLRAPGLGERPLLQALRSLCVRVGQPGLPAVECELPKNADQLPPAVAEVLWRVAQEGLANVQKHAQARHAKISLLAQPREVLLRVKDDGLGLSPEAEFKPGHYGLRGMRERVEGLGGSFSLSTGANGGTLLEARVPVIA